MFLTIIKLTLDHLTLILASQSINHKWRRFKHRLYLHGLIDWPYHPSCQRQVFAAVRHIDEESEDEEEDCYPEYRYRYHYGRRYVAGQTRRLIWMFS